jgi:hypothetical protein
MIEQHQRDSLKPDILNPVRDDNGASPQPTLNPPVQPEILTKQAGFLQRTTDVHHIFITLPATLGRHLPGWHMMNPTVQPKRLAPILAG